MLEITCYDNDGKKLDHLTQWDMGQTVSVKGATYVGSPVFHFCNRRSYRAYAVESTTQDDSISAKIPNALLKEPYPIEAYMYYQKEPGSAKTVYAFSIPVTPRKQPDDYIFTDNIDVISLIEIKKEMMAALEELRAAIQDSKDSIVQVTTVIDEAKAATQEATSASASANAAAETAAQATTDARAAIQEAGHATEAATQAATEAITAKNEAATAAITATEAAGRADTATQGANTAAEAANAAAKSANDAAEKAKIDVAGKLDKPTAAPKVNDVLKVESVNPDGSFNAVWSEPPATVVVDETLQNAGQAADAAKTGEELKKLDKNKENIIVKSAFGESIILDDSGEAPIASMKLFGKTTQDGTPTPDAPVPLVSPGDDGNIGVSVTGKNLLRLDIESSQSISGITFLVNSDKSITINGTATSPIYLNIAKCELYTGVRYTLTGSTGGSALKYALYLNNPNFTGQNFNYDVPAEFEMTASGKFTVSIFVAAGASLHNITMLPMVRESSVSDSTYEPYNGGSITTPTPNGLPGIKVSSGGNYIDSTGQQWVCDEVDLERGVYVKRVGMDKISKLKYDVSFNTVSRFSKVISMQDNTLTGRALFTHLPFIDSNYNGDYEHFYIWNSTIYVFLRNEIAKDQNGIDAWLLKNNPMVVYALETHVETPLSPELIAAYRALHTNFPNTNILNDEGCEMSVSYFTDTEVGKYISGLSRSSVRTDPATKSPVTLGYDDGGLYIMTE